MNISHLYARMGAWPETIGLPEDYFRVRGCVLDCRGALVIDATSIWGFRVSVYTRSHDIASGEVGATVNRAVQVDAGAWVGSGATLYNCHIGAGAIVACGAVVRNQDVAPHVMVAGNPARVIARWDGDHWAYLGAKREILA